MKIYERMEEEEDDDDDDVTIVGHPFLFPIQVRPDGFRYETLVPGSTGTEPRDGPPKKYAKIWLKSGAPRSGLFWISQVFYPGDLIFFWGISGAILWDF